jgi:hypothetical protein
VVVGSTEPARSLLRGSPAAVEISAGFVETGGSTVIVTSTVLANTVRVVSMMIAPAGVTGAGSTVMVISSVAGPNLAALWGVFGAGSTVTVISSVAVPIVVMVGRTKPPFCVESLVKNLGSTKTVR